MQSNLSDWRISGKGLYTRIEIIKKWLYFFRHKLAVVQVRLVLYILKTVNSGGANSETF